MNCEQRDVPTGIPQPTPDSPLSPDNAEVSVGPNRETEVSAVPGGSDRQLDTIDSYMDLDPVSACGYSACGY